MSLRKAQFESYDLGFCHHSLCKLKLLDSRLLPSCLYVLSPKAPINLYPLCVRDFLRKLNAWLQDLWIRFTVPKPLPASVDDKGQPLPPPTPEEAKRALRAVITNYVADGWNIEIENDLEVVLGRKAKFHWVGKLIIFLLLLLLFAPVGVFYLIVVIIKGVTAKPARIRVWIDEMGRLQRQ